MNDEFVFWDDMWNETKKEDEELTNECCGQWDEFGECSCKNKKRCQNLVHQKMNILY